MAWKGSGNDNLNVARVLATRLLGIDGVEGLEWKRILTATSDTAPAIASHNGRLFLAWKGSGNENLNLAFSDDNGLTFKGTTPFGDTSDYAPTLASFNGTLYYGWTGEDDHLNVARVTLFGNTAGSFGIEGLTGELCRTSSQMKQDVYTDAHVRGMNDRHRLRCPSQCVML